MILEPEAARRVLFERVYLLYVEARLFGTNLCAPPKDTVQCWWEGMDSTAHCSSVFYDEYHLRFWCAGPGPLWGAGANQMWTLFFKVRPGDWHPLLGLFEEIRIRAQSSISC